MSRRSRAMTRMTPPKMTSVRMTCSSLMYLSSSFEGRGVHESAVQPEAVEAAIDPESAGLADVALVHLAVVADRHDGAGRPVTGQAQRHAEDIAPVHDDLTSLVEPGPDSLLHLVLREARLFSADEAEQDPADQRDPLGIAIQHDRPERLLGDALRQDHMGVRAARRLEPHRRELRRVGGVG